MTEKSYFSSIILSFLLFFISGGATHLHAGQSLNSESVQEAHAQSSYITVNIGVELGGLEKAAEEAAQGIILIGDSLNTLASNPELTPEQSARINQVLSQVDRLSEGLSSTVDQIPRTMEKSLSPVVELGERVSSEIKLIVVVSAIAIVLVIFVALVMAYCFVLAPGTKAVIRTTSLLDELASTLEKTAEIVETSSKQNLAVIDKLQVVAGGQSAPMGRNQP